MFVGSGFLLLSGEKDYRIPHNYEIVNRDRLTYSQVRRLRHAESMDFELIGEIREIQPIALGRGIRGLARLRRRYGSGRWRKLKGIARVRLIDGTIHTAEVHWYEAHGIGREELKIKFPLLD